MTSNQMLRTAVQTVEETSDPVGIAAVGEVAEMPDLVFVANDLVPSRNERLVHREAVGKWPPAEADYVAMAEMMVGGEPDFHDGLAEGPESEGAATLSEISNFEISELQNLSIPGGSAFFEPSADA
ncbi:hypothetical protein [Methylobacterium sp. OAE515]|uniref:hypothetical protein n=1 Tax=Methylobacterium sp. OAE515 TaxID=2817895 RepID=UPI001A042541